MRNSILACTTLFAFACGTATEVDTAPSAATAVFDVEQNEHETGLDLRFKTNLGHTWEVAISQAAERIVVLIDGASTYELSYESKNDGQTLALSLAIEGDVRQTELAANDQAGREQFLSPIQNHQRLIRLAMNGGGEVRNDQVASAAQPSVGRSLKQLQCYACAAKFWLSEGCAGNVGLFLWCLNPLNSPIFD